MGIRETFQDWFKPTVTIDEAFLSEFLTEAVKKIGPADGNSKTTAGDIDVLSQKFKEYSSIIGKNYQVAAALGAVYTKVTNTRKEMLREIEKVRPFYLTDAILTQFADDALAPDTMTDDVIKVTSKNKKVNDALQELDQLVKFDALIMDNITDILAYGEYTLKCNVEKDKGITGLEDNVDQTKVVSLTRNGEVEGFLELDETARKITIKGPYEYIKFAIPSHKIRMDLASEIRAKDAKEFKDKIPRYVRIGKSYIYPILEKIKELELLEQLIPATNLAKLSSGTLLGVSVPQGMDPEKGMEVARKVEGLINKKVGVDANAKLLTVENILSSAGRLKVIPVFGDKGTVTKFDYKQDEPSDLLGSVTDIRKVLCNSVGIPYELIFGGESDDTKGHLLKRYARYLRKLKQIQKAVAIGIRQICFIHLVNKNIDFTTDDIQIEFRNKLIEIDALDKLEYLDASISLLGNAKSFLMDLMIDPTVGPVVRIGPFLQFVNNQFGTLGIENVIDVKAAMKLKIEPTPPTPAPGEEGAGAEETPPAEGE